MIITRGKNEREAEAENSGFWFCERLSCWGWGDTRDENDKIVKEMP
jgi:hypothetical protein